MGRADNSTMLQEKKSARQIYAEAFMEDEQFGTVMGGSKRIYSDDDKPDKFDIKAPVDGDEEDEGEKIDLADGEESNEKQDGEPEAEEPREDLVDSLMGDDEPEPEGEAEAEQQTEGGDL